MNHHSGLRKTSLGILATILFLYCSGTASPQNNGILPQTSDLKNTAELEAFFDGVISTFLFSEKLAGATIGIVHQGDVVLLKAYGYADYEQNIYLDPETSLFRIASISKLFTWIAVFQQWEQGKLDLDEDINNYLTAFRIPDTFDEPISLRSLLSHTAGFEDVVFELFLREDASIPSNEEVFKKRIPTRIMPPLQEAAYSNHGTGLAEYLVELVSGMPFEDYVEQYILDPLGMHCTTFRQPLPDNLKPYMSNGFAYRNGSFQAQPFEMMPMTGVGGASSSARDMLIFAEALLNHTRSDTISLLDSATFALMKQPVLQHAPNMNPALHGFLDIGPPHLRVIGHGGNTFLFHSVLALIPDYQTALFFSVNSENGTRVPSDILNKFIDRYFPNTGEKPETILLTTDYLKGFTGAYIPNRRSHSDLLKFAGVMNPVHVELKNNSLYFKDMWGKVFELIPTDSTTFAVRDENFLIGFNRPAGENAGKLYISNRPILAFDRMQLQYSVPHHLSLFIASIIASIIILIFWPWLYYLRKNYDRRPKALGNLPTFSKTVAWITALFIMLTFIALLSGFSKGSEIIFGIPAILRIGLFFPFAAMPFLLLMTWNSIVIWKTPKIKLKSRLFYNFANLIFLVNFWQLYFWNLLGWQY